MINTTSKSAWQSILNTTTARLPIKPSQLLSAHGFFLFTYQHYCQATGIDAATVLRDYGTDGFTQQINGIYTVFYNACNPPARIRWTLAHELGHILLGHITPEHATPSGGDGNVQDFCDVQADNFAARLLCPEAVVHFCGVGSSAELQQLTDLSRQAAQIAWRNLSERRARGTFVLDAAEQPLLARFHPFIARYITERLTQSPDLAPPTVKKPFYRI